MSASLVSPSPVSASLVSASMVSASPVMAREVVPEENGPAGPAQTSGAGELLHAELTGEIIGAFYTVYGELGYGFVDSVYVRALAMELFHRRIAVAREVPVTVRYRGVTVGNYRAALVVADTVIVEVKAGEHTTDADRHQLLNHLRSSGKEVGLLLHFGPRAVARRVVATRRGVAMESPADPSRDTARQ